MAIKNQQQTEDAQQLFLTATVSHEDLGMTTGQNVAAHRRRLRSELRNERKLAHLTQKEVARAMDWSPSKMLRIETGSNGISVTDLRALLSYYNLKDKRRIEDLINLARAAKSGAVRDDVRRLLRPDRQPGPPLVEQPVKSSSALVPAQRTQEPTGVTALCAHPTPASSTEPPEVTGEQVGHRRAVGCPQDKTSQP